MRDGLFLEGPETNHRLTRFWALLLLGAVIRASISCVPWLVLSAWNIAKVTGGGLASGQDWGIAVAHLVAWTIVALPLGTFDAEELSRFEKYARLTHTAIHP
jgi:hypothetical protein